MDRTKSEKRGDDKREKGIIATYRIIVYRYLKKKKKRKKKQRMNHFIVRTCFNPE